MTNINLIWCTPEIDKIIGYVARVSNPDNQNNEKVSGLLAYCAKNQHWSVFEVANVCLEINSTRDIARQMLRHRSFNFSEFSQRYQNTDVLPKAPLRECRLQDTKNRQNSLANDNGDLDQWWAHAQGQVSQITTDLYQDALKRGIAKEQARALLPEGLTSSRIYMNGTLRSWITYLQSRLDPSTQSEHRAIAREVLDVLRGVAPVTIGAFFPEGVTA